MNSSVFEIIGQLVKRLLYDGDITKDEKKLINSLREEGYNLEEINKAFEFIYSSSEIINLSKTDQQSKDSEQQFKHRRLNYREKFKLSLETQGIILELKRLNLVNEEELEELINKSIMQRDDTIGIKQFWKVVKTVIDDELRLYLISQKIDPFNQLSQAEGKYLN